MEREPRSHRKTIKHYDLPHNIHLLTFSCYQRRPLLTKDAWREWLAESIDRALVNHQFHLIAFVFMPEHVHLLVWPLKIMYKTKTLLAGLKRPFSYRVGQSLREMSSPLLKQLTVRAKGKEAFRFWQAGPGHDRNITSREGAGWAIEYLHNNPVRRGLCERPEQWRWSSWRYYHCPGEPGDPRLPVVSGVPQWNME